MVPINFKEANSRFGPPSDMDESQVMTIYAYQENIQGGSCDGAHQVIVAWKPTPEEIEKIKMGAPIYLSVMGGLPPHFLSTSFDEARNVA